MKQIMIALLLLVLAALANGADVEIEEHPQQIGEGQEEQKPRKYTKAEVQAYHDNIWKPMDKDGDGFVTSQEIQAHYLEEYGGHTSPNELVRQANQFLDVLDVDKDGKISEAEHYKDVVDMHAPFMDSRELEI
eukprot:TRINITY_DN1093_c1_g1_i1.p1 TRINITY_DN1093_c1_g1~~TRINITY_DN1093_c1_g1_i1.p1  ORF type:complete len:133 (+),score=32.19 TRINITY_DN1093_c1_g1_i1:83-481(+)